MVAPGVDTPVRPPRCLLPFLLAGQAHLPLAHLDGPCAKCHRITPGHQGDRMTCLLVDITAWPARLLPVGAFYILPFASGIGVSAVLSLSGGLLAAGFGKRSKLCNRHRVFADQIFRQVQLMLGCFIIPRVFIFALVAAHQKFTRRDSYKFQVDAGAKGKDKFRDHAQSQRPGLNRPNRHIF